MPLPFWPSPFAVARGRPAGPARRGCSSMVEFQPSKLAVRVRFPSPAPASRRVRLVPGFAEPAVRSSGSVLCTVRRPMLALPAIFPCGSAVAALRRRSVERVESAACRRRSVRPKQTARPYAGRRVLRCAARGVCDVRLVGIRFAFYLRGACPLRRTQTKGCAKTDMCL